MRQTPIDTKGLETESTARTFEKIAASVCRAFRDFDHYTQARSGGFQGLGTLEAGLSGERAQHVQPLVRESRLTALLL